MAAVSVQIPSRKLGARTVRARTLRASRTRLALALVLLGWFVVFVCAVFGSGAFDASGSGTVLSSGRTHTVAAGETLWSIAADSAGGAGDLRAVVHEIASLNHLSASGVRAGQVLVLP